MITEPKVDLTSCLNVSRTQNCSKCKKQITLLAVSVNPVFAEVQLSLDPPSTAHPVKQPLLKEENPQER